MHVTETVDALPPADRRSAFANAPMGIALTTPAGVLVDANPAFTAMVGRSAKELHGRSFLDLVHPEAVSAAREAHVTLTSETDRFMRHETRLVRPEGSDVPVQITASWVPEAEDGQAAHLVLIIEDITERKALE